MCYLFMVNHDFLETVYTISATIFYNSERGSDLEDVLCEYIKKHDEKIDIKTEFKKNIVKKMELFHSGNLLKVLFNNYDKMRSVLYDMEEYNNYLNLFFRPFSKEFKEKWGYDLQLYTLLSSAIYANVILKSRKENFKWDIYEFNSKEEYVNLSFIEIPDLEYRKKWEKIITFNPQEIIEPLIKYFPKEDVVNVFNTLTFDITSFKEKKIRLSEKPILKISNESFIILIPKYAISALPQKLYEMFTQVKEYNDKKGKIFEKRALYLIDTIPKCKLHKNIKYDKYEIDGILNLKNSTWFIECSSHQPDSNSFNNDEERIIYDLEKTVKKCELQAIRAIDNIKHPNIKNKVNSNTHGIFIILDGFYPNLNMEFPLKIVPKTSINRRIIINYFDLSFLMRQPEKDQFEHYLLWRTQDHFPINGEDETDTWTYFLNLKRDPAYMQGFKFAQEKGTAVNYIGDKFNDKRYLKKIIRKESMKS